LKCSLAICTRNDLLSFLFIFTIEYTSHLWKKPTHNVASIMLVSSKGFTLSTNCSTRCSLVLWHELRNVLVSEYCIILTKCSQFREFIHTKRWFKKNYSVIRWVKINTCFFNLTPDMNTGWLPVMIWSIKLSPNSHDDILDIHNSATLIL
jgi:hypothetical protein